MSEIAVGIITYKRPKSLERLLSGLLSQQGVPAFSVVVSDNDSAATGREACEAARKAGLNLTYVVEATQGIPQARNRVLASLPDDCRFVAWIDDDESPEPKWLQALLDMQKATESDIVMGSIEAVLPEGAPSWVKQGGFFNRRRFIDRATLGEGATNNCLMKLSSINDHNLRFDESLRYNGGTDTLFFRQAAKLGLRMIWSAEAVVKDYIPIERCNIGWMITRHFRAGNTLALCDMRLEGAKGWVQRLFHALSKIFQGLLNLPLGIVGLYQFARSALMLSRGVGMLCGLFGIQYQEYTPARVMRDRS